MTYEEFATELLKRLFEIDDVCSYCDEFNPEGFCDEYKKTGGNVNFDYCRNHVKQFVEKLHDVEQGMLSAAQAAYTVTKIVNPVTTTAKPGYDIHALVQKEFAGLYKRCALSLLDWGNLDGVLDFLYGHYNLFGDKELKPLIDFIEARCEVKK